MKRYSILGIQFGGFVGIVAGNIAGLAVTFIAAAQVHVIALPRDQQVPALLLTIQKSTPLYAAQFCLLALGGVLGGYIAARVAKRSMILNGTLSAWLCIALGVVGITATQNATTSLTQQLLLFALSPAFGALGGYLRRRQQGGGPPLDLAVA